MPRPSADATPERLQDLVDRLLMRDADAHAEAIEVLAEEGDERVVPYLLEVLVIDAIGNDWAAFGFPEVLRSRDPPRYLELPEVRWPGVQDALGRLAEPEFDSEHAWVEWESWYSQQDIEPLEGFEAWKLRLYRSYLPPVGGLLDCEPRDFDLQDIEAAGRRVVAVRDSTGDVAVYAAPPTPVERTDNSLVDAKGVEWALTRDELRAGSGETRERVPGRHGLWFAFRTHYDEAHVLR